jgi:hypothetical protein
MNCIMKKAIKNFFMSVGVIILLFGFVVLLAYLATISKIAVGVAIVVFLLIVLAYEAYDSAYDSCLEKALRGKKYE